MEWYFTYNSAWSHHIHDAVKEQRDTHNAQNVIIAADTNAHAYETNE